MSRRRRILLSAGLLAAVVGVVLGVLALLPPRFSLQAKPRFFFPAQSII
jgi:hypothetical protein